MSVNDRGNIFFLIYTRSRLESKPVSFRSYPPLKERERETTIRPSFCAKDLSFVKEYLSIKNTHTHTKQNVIYLYSR